MYMSSAFHTLDWKLMQSHADIAFNVNWKTLKITRKTEGNSLLRVAETFVGHVSNQLTYKCYFGAAAQLNYTVIFTLQHK